MPRLHRRTALAATALATLLWTMPASADTTLLNVSYDPDPRALPGLQQGLRRALEAKDR